MVKALPVYVVLDTEYCSVIIYDLEDLLFTEETAKDYAERRNKTWGEGNFIALRLAKITDPMPGWWEQ